MTLFSIRFILLSIPLCFSLHIRSGNYLMQRRGELHSSILDDTGSERLKKAKLRLAEAQGIIPFGSSDLTVDKIKVLLFKYNS